MIYNLADRGRFDRCARLGTEVWLGKRRKTMSDGKQQQKPPPEVLAINICDQVIRDELTKKVSLIGLFSVIRANGFPCTHPLMHIYVALTGGHGKHEMEVRLIRQKDQQPVIVMRGPIQFTNPLQVAELNFECRNVVFQAPGRYVVEVYCDNSRVPIGTRKFEVVSPKQISRTSGTEVV